MRIISQYLVSYPFEQLAIDVDDCRVMARFVSGSNKFCLGVYESCDRAKEVFKEINFHYENTPIFSDSKAYWRQRSFEMPEE